jgi:hypothetical protein
MALENKGKVQIDKIPEIIKEFDAFKRRIWPIMGGGDTLFDHFFRARDRMEELAGPQLYRLGAGRPFPGWISRGEGALDFTARAFYIRAIIRLVRMSVIVKWFIQAFERMITLAFGAVCVNYAFGIAKLKAAILFVE